MTSSGATLLITDALSTVRDFFVKFPVKKNPKTDMPVGDFFLAYLWLRGFKVVPLEEGE